MEDILPARFTRVRMACHPQLDFIERRMVGTKGLEPLTFTV